ncbi:MAG TPA: membrane protein insertase YidC [Planctomycetaceae bacterium]|nr:membrane protein insertase YidC [Planctomycetaceae bacterium]
MDQKRLAIWSISAAIILLGWQYFILPLVAPAPARRQLQPPAAQHAEKKPGEKNPDEQLNAQAKPGEGDKQPELNAPEPKKEKEAELPPLKVHPRQEVVLGSLDDSSAYRMQVVLDSRGAAVKMLELNDPRYRDLLKPKFPLSLLGGPQAPPSLETLQLNVPLIDAQLKPYRKNLNTVEWEVIPGKDPVSDATFRYVSPDGKLELRKEFSLGKVPENAPHDEAPAYRLGFKLVMKNLGDKPEQLQYTLQGPVGLPVESPESTRKYRDIVGGYLQDDGRVKTTTSHAKDVVVAFEKDKLRDMHWERPIRYIGVDIQYFAVLLLPQGDQLAHPYTSAADAMVVTPEKRKELSDVSVKVVSTELELGPAKGHQPEEDKKDQKADEGQKPEIEHDYLLFAGPMRDELLRPIGADSIIDWGISGNIGIPQAMLALLNGFHNLFPSWAWPYGWSIILLTVLVRSAMFPLSRKQALSAAKMQEIQPEIAALKKKYGNTPEKLQKAQMELFRKHNYNPFGGCLVMLIQLPIFIGLYQALSLSTDLRMAKFLWINNLAAPDALFTFPFVLPFLGTSQFNLLPIITIVLFIVQQKMFMPPPTDKEQEMQQKMMTFMTVFMGFMFYNVPAGLCVYFIASSLWGVAERKLLPKSKPAAASGTAPVPA